MDVGPVNYHSLSLSRQLKENGHPFRVWCFKCDGAHFQRDCNASRASGKIKANNGKGKGSPKEQKVRSKFPKAHNDKTLKTGISDLENLKSETSSVSSDGTGLYH